MAADPYDLVRQFDEMRKQLGFGPQRALQAPVAPRISPGVSPVAPAGLSAPTGPAAPAGAKISKYGLEVSPAEDWIISHESGWDVNARNPSSGAFGLWQGNPLSGTLQSIAKEVGVDPYTTDPAQQLQMFRHYVRGRYGTAENAQAFWQKNNWY